MPHIVDRVTICDDQSQTCDTQQQNFVTLNLYSASAAAFLLWVAL